MTSRPTAAGGRIGLGVAAVSLVAAACLGAFLQYQTGAPTPAPPAPAAEAFPDLSIQSGDMTMTVTGEPIDDDTTRLHMEFSNAGSEDQAATVTPADADDDLDAGPEPTVVPARSIRRRVIDVSKPVGDDRPVNVKFGIAPRTPVESE